jgi:hypothetical protein
VWKTALLSGQAARLEQQDRENGHHDTEDLTRFYQTRVPGYVLTNLLDSHLLYKEAHNTFTGRAV